MALELKDYQLDNGLLCPTVYARIEKVQGNKDDITLQVRYYVSEKASNDGTLPVVDEFYNFTPEVTPDSLNYHKQGYLHLKSLPQFSEARDV